MMAKSIDDEQLGNIVQEGAPKPGGNRLCGVWEADNPCGRMVARPLALRRDGEKVPHTL